MSPARPLLRPALLGFCLLGLSVSLPAQAGPRESVHAALVKFLAQTAFHGDVQASVGGHQLPSTVEFQAPDRYRISRNGEVSAYIIGHDMYLNLHGRTIHSPTPATVDSFRDPALIDRIDHGPSVLDLGLETVNGTPSHKYRATLAAETPGEITLWIATASGLPVQVQTTMQYPGRTLESTIRYSRYNDPAIRISPPH